MTTATEDPRPLAIFLMGPTAAGKTEAAMAIHESLGHSLISVDSAMVYRGLDIGSAKPSAEELARAPHRLIDIRDPVDVYSAADFRHDALTEMRQISAAGQVPVLVGGTMLYFKQLMEGGTNLPASSPSIRQVLEAELDRRGLASLHAELARVDPPSGERIHPHDPQRTLRALEVYRLTGRPLSTLWEEQRQVPFPWRVIALALAPADRGLLHQRIAARFTRMLSLGLVEEVALLRERREHHGALPAMKSVGYRQVWDFLDGRYGHDELVARGIIATRQLAKRQLTWLRGWDNLVWFDIQRSGYLNQVVNFVRDQSA